MSENLVEQNVDYGVAEIQALLMEVLDEFYSMG